MGKLNILRCLEAVYKPVDAFRSTARMAVRVSFRLGPRRFHYPLFRVARNVLYTALRERATPSAMSETNKSSASSACITAISASLRNHPLPMM